MKINTKLSNSLNIIVSCGVIWNFLRSRNDIDIYEVEGEEQEDITQLSSDSSAGNEKRRQYILDNF